MSGPRPVVIKPPDHRSTEFEVSNELRRQFKGDDVSKEDLEKILSEARGNVLGSV
jgi:hypothetical protein